MIKTSDGTLNFKHKKNKTTENKLINIQTLPANSLTNISFKSKKSNYIVKAEKMYNVNKIGATNELAKATGCSKKALAKIINKILITQYYFVI